jgi:tRNA pseudouridine synthase 10
MLGSGRPFVIDISNPKNKFKPLEKVKELEDLINSNTTLIKVVDVDVCDKNYFAVLKKYEDSKQKLYTCFVWVEKIITQDDIELINSVRDLKVIQKTPIRVMHRRTLMDRNKTIYKLEAELISEHFMVKFIYLLI